MLQTKTHTHTNPCEDSHFSHFASPSFGESPSVRILHTENPNQQLRDLEYLTSMSKVFGCNPDLRLRIPI